MLHLGQRALTASNADGDLFTNRTEELATIERALGLGFNVYVHGPSGSGRTSLLNRVAPQAHRGRIVNLREADTLEVLIDRLVQHIRPSSSRLETSINEAFTQIAALTGPVATDRLEPLRRAISAGTRYKPLLLDNLDPQLRHELFGRQRDELWELKLQWVVVGDTPRLDPLADTFFETSVALEALTPDSIRELLLRRGRQGDSVQQEQMQQIADTLADVLGPATPRRVMTTARAVFLSPDPESHLKQLRAQQYVHHQLSATARLVLDALYAVGPAHAGDEQLLKQVGTTRSRIVQVLRELEDADLVRSVQAGRRKLYAPAPSDARQVEDGQL